MQSVQPEILLDRDSASRVVVCELWSATDISQSYGFAMTSLCVREREPTTGMLRNNW